MLRRFSKNELPIISYHSSLKYENQEENILVIYENADGLIFTRSDLEEIIELNRQNFREKKLIDAYKEIWLLDGKRIYSVY